MQTQKIIEGLGYTPNEAKVYLAALSLGECLVSDLATKIKLPRSSVQIIFEKLHKKGLMSFYVRNRYKIWVTENPERLLSQLQQHEELVRSTLPALERLRKQRPKESRKPQVRVFNSRDEIKLMFDDMLEERHHILAIIPQDNFLNLFANTTVIDDFMQSRVRRFLRLRVLAPATKAGRALKDATSDTLSEVRLLPEYVDIETAVFMYASKVALIMPNPLQPTGVLIEDAGIRDTQKAVFEELWEKAVVAADAEVGDIEPSLRALADGSAQPLLLVNDQIEILYVNAAWEAMFGYTLPEVRGQNPRMLGSGQTPEEVYVRMWEALGSGKQFHSDEVIDTKKSGESFHVQSTMFPLKVQGRLYYVQVVDDISGRDSIKPKST